jgi:hypothetical protein
MKYGNWFQFINKIITVKDKKNKLVIYIQGS